jgi:phage-related minor tail protein
MAGKNIRGITVEIGGDTTKLGKAIEKSEKQSRSLQVELREIEKLLKFDPTNTELLAQKQKVLTEAIEETSKKLDVLKEAEAGVIAQFERGEIGEDQLRAFQREITKTESSLNGMQNELLATDKAIRDVAKGGKVAEDATSDYEEAVKKAKDELAEFKDKASETFETLKDGAKIMGTALGGAMIATGGYALKLSTDFDKAFNTLATRTGASADEMVELNEAMENVYANNFGESIEDVAESMATVKQNTKLSGDELQNATERALLLRDTFEFDVNESTRTAKMLMDQYGMSAEDAYNLIAQGAQNGLDKNGDLLDTINEYSVHFNNLGLSAEDMFNMLVNGADNGTFSVDKLGDAVKEFSIRAIDGSDATAEGFKTIGLNADDMATKFGKGGESAKAALQETATALFNMEDPIAQNAAGVALFGTMWEDLGVDGVKALMNLEGEVATSKNALEDINNTKYDDIGSAIQGLGRTLETDVVEPLGEELKPVVEDVIDYVQANGPQIKDILAEVVKKIGEFVGFVVNNGPTILSVLSGIGAAFVTWKVASLINGVVGAIKAFKLANEGATIAQWALNVAMNANPIGIIVALIAGLVTAFVLLWNNCEGFRNFWIGLWEKIKVIFAQVVQWFSDTIPKIGEFFVNLWESIGNVFSAVGAWFNDNVIQPIVNAFQTAIDWISTAFSTATTWVNDNVIQPIINAFNSVIDWFVNAITWFNDNVITPITTFYETWISPVVDKIIEMITKTIEIVVALFVGLWNLLRDTVITPIINGFLDLWAKVSEFFSNLWADIVAIWQKVSGWFNTSVIQPVVNYFKSLYTKVSEFFVNLWNGIVNIWQKVSNWFNNTVIQPVVNAFKSLWTNVTNSAQSAWSGIKSIFSSVKSWFSSTFSAAWEAVKNVFSNWGSFFSGLWDKIKTTFSNIGTNIANAISGAVRSGINGVISAIERTINSGVSLINGAIGLINKLPGVSVGRISSLSLPRLAKGGIVENPTIAEIGENGREAIIPLEKNTGWIKKVARDLNSHLTTGASGELLDRLDRIYERLDRLQVVLDSGELVGGIVDPIDEALSYKSVKTARGW